ncbi:MAG: polysulfide reductase NrfD [Chloroflexi bacterium]|nr:polysulfide reductase NrfD [Chloroflexota bacterium]
MKRKKWSPFVWWVLGLSFLVAIGAVAGIAVFVRGLSITNLSDLVPWGLWIVIDLSAIALGAGAFMLSAAVYLLGLKQYQPVARTAVFIGLIAYSMAMMMLLLDIGRPERFWHGFAFWNYHSPLWEVTMCVGLYFIVLILEVTPIFGQADWLKQRWPNLSRRLEHMHHYSPILAVAGLGLSALHQSSLGATYGVLQARPIWYRPGLAVLFIVSAMAAGPALTVLASTIAARLSRRAIVNEPLLDQLSRFIGWVLVVYLYLRFWDTLSMGYNYEPARSEGLKMLTTGSLSFNFWVGEILLGIVAPMILLLNGRFRRNIPLRTTALALIVAGLVAYRWDINMVGQLVVFNQLPQGNALMFTRYFPSLVEIMAGVGVVTYGLLSFTLGVRFLKIVNHDVAESLEEVQHSIAIANAD